MNTQNIIKKPDEQFPSNLLRLHEQEEYLRKTALTIIQDNPKSSLHLKVIERTMTLAKIVVDYPVEDEDFKVIKMLSIRLFNAFGASLKLMFSGYHQNSAMVMRDTLETMFLMDLFRTDHTLIERWRFAERKEMKNTFSPAAVRKTLDERDGLNNKKREEIYKMFSDLASHPNMHSQHMLRPQKGGDIVMGVFMEETALKAGLDEMGRLAVQAGGIMNAFLVKGWDIDSVRTSFVQAQEEWMKTFYR